MREFPSPTLPAEVHTPHPPSTHVKRPKLYIRLDRLFPPAFSPKYRRALALGLLTAAAVGILLWRWSGWRDVAPSGLPGGIHGGVPVTTQPAGNETDTRPADGSGESEIPQETVPPDHPDGTAPESDTAAVPSDPDETLPPEPPAESERESSPPPESGSDGMTDPPASPDTAPGDPTVTAAPESEGGTEPAADPEPESGTEPADEPAPVPPPVPEGCFPIASADLSEPLRGAGYIYNEGVTLPTALPADSPWRVNTPAVLIVNTHPYEGYHDGSPWYDPALGDLARTDSPSAPDGVVALSVTLTRALRDRGITVIHLRVPTNPEESSADLYGRTEAMIRYYCRLYPDIGLVLDLRRSAELTETGEILRTEGTVNGVPTAQLRITVSGGREPRALGHDLTVALALRESLWEESPALSRPVRVRSGSGLVSDLTDLRVLTLETGSAGNTYAEAVRLVPPLARALEQILIKFS